MAEPTVGYFDPDAPIGFLSGSLPHWRQENVTYFVTFRLSDSLPQEKLRAWKAERTAWLKAHPEPHDAGTRRKYYDRFPHRLQRWLDAGYGSCILALPDIRLLVENTLGYFHGVRYELDHFVVAPNHVHVLVTPKLQYTLSQVLHSWKSYSSHEMLKFDAVTLHFRKEHTAGTPRTRPARTPVWQKESFDHIVRNPESLERFRAYIMQHQRPAPNVAAAPRR